jgi:hypothetical protein
MHADSIGRQSTSLKALSRRTRESGAHASTRIKAHAAATKLGDDDESALCKLNSTWGLADRMVSRSASEASPRRARRPTAGVAQWASVRAKSLTQTSRTSALMASSRLARVFLSEGQRSCQRSSPAWECGHIDQMQQTHIPSAGSAQVKEGATCALSQTAVNADVAENLATSLRPSVAVSAHLVFGNCKVTGTLVGCASENFNELSWTLGEGKELFGHPFWLCTLF